MPFLLVRSSGAIFLYFSMVAHCFNEWMEIFTFGFSLLQFCFEDVERVTFFMYRFNTETDPESKLTGIVLKCSVDIMFDFEIYLHQRRLAVL